MKCLGLFLVFAGFLGLIGLDHPSNIFPYKIPYKSRAILGGTLLLMGLGMISS